MLVAARFAVLLLIAAFALTVCGCGSSHPRTEVLRSANPLTSDIYLRITGPGGAVSYVTKRLAGGGFSKFSFTKQPRQRLFLPLRVRDRKLCASTHTIRSGDTPDLQKWRGKTLEISVYGNSTSGIFCAALGPWLYLAGF